MHANYKYIYFFCSPFLLFPVMKILIFYLLSYSFLVPIWSIRLEILTYSGKMSVSGQPYNGTAELKIALVNRTGTFSLD